MNIISLDPGGTTGWATYVSGTFDMGETASGPHHKELFKLLKDFKADTVVCENFFYQRRDKAVLDSVKYIAITELYCELTGTKLVMQAPHLRKFWTDGRLKALKLYSPGHKDANDAVRHLLYYLTGSGVLRWRDLIKKPQGRE